MDKMEQLFADDYDIIAQGGFKYDIIPSRRSIANHDFDKMKGDGPKSMIGEYDHLVEIVCSGYVAKGLRVRSSSRNLSLF